MTTEEQIREPQMDILLPKLEGWEMNVLVATCRNYSGKFPVFSKWLEGLLGEENARRESNGKLEAEMPTLGEWTGNELSQCLLATYVLCRLPLPENVHRFFEECHKHIVASSSSALQIYCGEQPV